MTNRLLVFSLLLLSLSSQAAPHLSYGASIAQLRQKTALPILNTLALPKSCFTQGFTIDVSRLYLSCGQYKKSSLLVYAMPTKSALSASAAPQLKKLHQVQLPPHIFAEGLAIDENFIYLLSWKAQTLFLFNKNQPAMHTVKTQSYLGEGWGLAFDKQRQQFLFSDGSHSIYSIHSIFQSASPVDTMKKQGNVNVEKAFDISYQNKLSNKINELEIIGEQLLFNRWFDHHIYSVNVETEQKTVQARRISLEALSLLHHKNDVLNGIAFDASDNTIWITGKNWGIAYQMPASYFLSMP